MKGSRPDRMPVQRVGIEGGTKGVALVSTRSSPGNSHCAPAPSARTEEKHWSPSARTGRNSQPQFPLRPYSRAEKETE